MRNSMWRISPHRLTLATYARVQCLGQLDLLSFQQPIFFFDIEESLSTSHLRTVAFLFGFRGFANVIIMVGKPLAFKKYSFTNVLQKIKTSRGVESRLAAGSSAPKVGHFLLMIESPTHPLTIIPGPKESRSGHAPV